MKKEVWGRLNLSWGGNVLLPLEQAHKVQAILAQYAVGFGDAYRPNEPNIRYMTNYSIPEVGVLPLPDCDCRELTPKQVSEWEEMVRNSEGNTFLTPQQYIAIQGDSNEQTNT